MSLDLATLRAALRTWIVDALEDATVTVIFAHQSAPLPDPPYVTIHVGGIASPEWDQDMPLVEFPIESVNLTTDRFTVDGDQTGLLPVGRKFVVADSTGNDGEYEVLTVVYDSIADATRVKVVSIPDGTGDGVITGIVRTGGTRILTATVDCFGKESERDEVMERVERIRSALGLVGTRDKLRTAGMAVYGTEPVVNLTALLDTMRQPRATFDARFGVGSVQSEYVGIVERATITATIQHPDDSTAETATVTYGLE